jgi:hypothetical protein
VGLVPEVIHGVRGSHLLFIGWQLRGLRRILPLATVVALSALSMAQAQMPPPALTPETIRLGTLYHHAHVHIGGTAPSDAGVLVVIRGDEQDEFLNRKGRVGILWLNADRIHVQRAPSVFLTFSSAPVTSLLDRASLDQYELDEAAIRNRILCFCQCKCKLSGTHGAQVCTRGMKPGPAYGELLRSSFLNLKENEGSYHSYPGAVTLAQAADPGTDYALDFEWPGAAQPGSYRVEVYACCNQKVIASSLATLKLVEVGFPAYVTNLAFARPWTYGWLAVLVAMVAGFGIDALTSRIRRPKHGSRSGKGRPPLAPTRPAEPEPAGAHEKETVHRV